MHAGRIIGRVMASVKYETLEGIKLLLLQPLSWQTQEPLGDPIVAADTVGAGSSELVLWVASREAAVAVGGIGLKKSLPPVDAAVVGIVDGVNLQEWTKSL